MMVNIDDLKLEVEKRLLSANKAKGYLETINTIQASIAALQKTKALGLYLDTSDDEHNFILDKLVGIDCLSDAFLEYTKEQTIQHLKSRRRKIIDEIEKELEK